MNERESATTRSVTEAFFRRHPEAAARALERRPDAIADALVADLEPSLAAPVLAAMHRDQARRVLATAAETTAHAVVRAMEPAAAANLLRGLPAARREELLAALPADTVDRIRASLRYPPGTAGALADPSAFTAPPEATAGETLDGLRRAPGRLRAYVFVVARDGRLAGVVDLSTLIASPGERILATIARTDAARLRAAAAREEILAHPSWSDLRVLPVVDGGGRFLGVVRFRVLRELADAQASPVEAAAVGIGLELGELWCALVLDGLDEIGPAPDLARPAGRG